MGLPEPLAEALEELGREEAPEPEPEASVDPYTHWKAALDRHRRIAQKLESQTADLKAAGIKMLSDLEAVAKTTQQPPPGIDEFIDSLLQTEIERRRDLPDSSERRHLPDVFTLPQLTQSEKILSATVQARYENALKDGLAALRDLRWALMALRAEYEDAGDAPVFDNPDDLLQHLQASTK